MRPLSTGFEVRPLQAHDLVGMARCMAIDADTFPSPSIVLGLPGGRPILVARAGAPSSVVGFLASAASPAALYVQGLAVAAPARRHGVGRALIRACIAGARALGVRSVTLHVAVANGPAVSLYDSEGFEVRRVLRNFYRPGLYSVPDAYEMVLPTGRGE